jgi:hypothetical protein
MKKMIILIIMAMTLVSCQSITHSQSTTKRIYTIEGHKYTVEESLGIVHDKSCKCKRK